MAVTDVYDGGAPSALGTMCDTDASPKTFASYTQTVTVPTPLTAGQEPCVSKSNTATATVSSSPSASPAPSVSDSVTVKVCKSPRECDEEMAALQ